ncbi:bifunctional 2-polyprenyl-6-hydroxyphenol methylase/3-demethylubiquinol 3-O-methyltransferase UbiG [Arthrobacter sp. 4R501]|uniref:class I SAM-dependent methyltransferase n=1 Tax=Arthrobacter sp. 4R501 TaxID=2058886 RepID=UPI001C669B51|nr:class I SAM-dependent methyltransferase [Arthrobacter sp. 4R501]
MSVDGMPLPAWKHAGRGRPGYPADAPAWNRWYAETDYGWAPASSSVRSELNGLAPGRALDLGAGDGRHAVWLAGRGWRVQAMDFSSEALAIGRERAFAEGVTGLITWSVADVTAHTPDPGSLDLVLAAFLHLPGPELEGTIARSARSLVPGGLFLYIGHAPADPRESAPVPRTAAVLHDSARVAAWARRAGLYVESAGTRSRPVPGSRRPALDCVVLARCPPPPDPSPSTEHAHREVPS